MIFDTHAHVFTRQCRLAPDRRYEPDYEAPLAHYLAALDRQGIAGGVLVQPSFLGTDNSYLLECLTLAPSRLRGIVVIDPKIGHRQLDTMASRGVVGLRLNLVGFPPEWRPGTQERDLAAIAAARDWQVEVQARGPVLTAVLHQLLPIASRLVIDHFGLPLNTENGADPGFTALLQSADTERVWVKLSAPYRFADIDAGTAGKALMDAFGPSRLMWGSDWPWTQHEMRLNFKTARDWPLNGIERQHRSVVLGETACELFGFKMRAS